MTKIKTVSNFEIRISDFYCMTSPITFIKQTRDEIVKVIWPTKNEIIRLTAIVILISILVGLYIGGLDLLFAKAIEMILK